MATRSIKTKIELDGEQNYKKALSDINAGLKVLSSEMKLASAQFADNADSVEALTSKGDILERQILSQKEKIDTLRKVLDASAAAYGEADSKTSKWKVSLNNAEADLAKMERDLNANTEALKKASEGAESYGDSVGKAGDKTKNFGEQAEGSDDILNKLREAFGLSEQSATGLGDALDKAADKLGVKLPSGATNALNAVGKLNIKTLAAVSAFAALAAATIKCIDKLKDMTSESAKAADEIMTLSMQTGLTTEQLQEFDYASELIDVSLDTLQTSLTRLTNNMQNAANGTGDAKDAFATLGVSITDTEGHLRTSNEVFYEVIDALGEVGNYTERDALAMDIFGRSAQDLNPLIIQGSDKLREYAEEAHNVGYVLDTDTLEALGAVDDAQQRLLKTQESVTNQISAEYAPHMEEALGNTRDFVKKLGDAVNESGVVDSFGSMLTSVTGLLEPAGELIISVLPALTTAFDALAYVIATVADALTIVVGLFQVLTGNWDEGVDNIKTGLSMNTANGKLSNYQRYTGEYRDYKWDAEHGWRGKNEKDYNELYNEWLALSNNGKTNSSFELWVQTRNASGSNYWRGGYTWVGENGPEIVYLPRGSSISTAQESRNTGGDVYYITIDAKSVKEFNDIVTIAKNQRRVSRMEG